MIFWFVVLVLGLCFICIAASPLSSFTPSGKEDFPSVREVAVKCICPDDRDKTDTTSSKASRDWLFELGI